MAKCTQKYQRQILIRPTDDTRFHHPHLFWCYSRDTLADKSIIERHNSDNRQSAIYSTVTDVRTKA